jgi:hypothetical protein
MTKHHGAIFPSDQSNLVIVSIHWLVTRTRTSLDRATIIQLDHEHWHVARCYIDDVWFAWVHSGGGRNRTAVFRSLPGLSIAALRGVLPCSLGFHPGELTVYLLPKGRNSVLIDRSVHRWSNPAQLLS